MRICTDAAAFVFSPRSQVVLGNAHVLEVPLPVLQEFEAELRGQLHSQLQLGNETGNTLNDTKNSDRDRLQPFVCFVGKSFCHPRYQRNPRLLVVSPVESLVPK